MKIRRLISILLVLVLTPSVLLVCSSIQVVDAAHLPPMGNTALAAEAPQPAASAEKTYKERIRIGINAEPTTVLTPTKSTSAMCQMIGISTHNQLVNMNIETKEVTGELAESWEVSADGTVYTFKLRKGVKFSNGEELTAEDVKFSIEQRVTKGAISAMVKCITTVNVIDPYTVEIALSGAVQDILYTLSSPPSSIVCKKAVEAEGDTGEQHGTGAYSIKKYVQGEYVLLTRNEMYFGEKPLTRELEFVIYLEDSTRLIALETNEIDICYSPANADIPFVTSNPELSLVSIPGNNIYYIGFNTQTEPFNNEKLRQAIACAVNKEAAIAVAFEGLADVATSVMVPNMPLYSEVSVFDYDLAKAKQLMAEAGYPDGGLKVTMWVDRADEQYMGITFQENLKELGIEMDVVQLEATTLKASWDDPKYQLTIQKFGPTGPDINFSYVFASTASANRSKVKDPYVDETIAKAAIEPDSKTRSNLYKELNTYITEKAYWVPVCIPQVFVATRSNLLGAQYAGNTSHDFTYAYIAEN